MKTLKFNKFTQISNCVFEIESFVENELYDEWIFEFNESDSDNQILSSFKFELDFRKSTYSERLLEYQKELNSLTDIEILKLLKIN